MPGRKFPIFLSILASIAAVGGVLNGIIKAEKYSPMLRYLVPPEWIIDRLIDIYWKFKKSGS